MKKSDLFFNVLRLPVDFVMLLLAGAATYIFRTKLLSAFRPVLFEFNLPLNQFLILVLFVSLVFIVAYAISGLYSMKAKIGRLEEFSKIAVASSAGIMLVIVYIFLQAELFNSRFLVLGGWLFAIIFVFLGRQLVRFLRPFFVSRYDFGIHRLIVIGNDDVAESIISAIKINPSGGYRIIGQFPEPNVESLRNIESEIDPVRGPACPAGMAGRRQGRLTSNGIDEIILSNPNYPADKIVELVDFCNERHIIFKFIPNVYQILTTNFDIDMIGRFPLIELKRTPLDGWGRVAKRVGDILAGMVGLILFSPLFLVCALAVKWETEGPVFARLTRVSRSKEFKLFKFRSMIENAEELKPLLAAFNERQDSPLFKMKDDPRLTKVGKFLRKYRLDELPQFWNVLRGDISLVGPRPHQPDEIELYQKHHRKVLAIKAGATGLAQVSGSSDLPFDKEVAIDSFYIENWSLGLDLKIILKTIFKMFTDRSAV